MIDKQVIAYLRYVHGSYNTLVVLLFIYQGSLGLRIRKERKAGGGLPAAVVRRHRRQGPVLVVLGLVGYLVGLTLAYMDHGHVVHFPLHFLTGSAIALSLVATFLVSRKIRGPESPWRRPHFVLGLVVLFLYVVQVFLGMGILF